MPESELYNEGFSFVQHGSGKLGLVDISFSVSALCVACFQ